MIIKNFVNCTLIVYTILLVGCSTTTPVYQPDFGSVNTLKNYELQKMGVNTVALANPKLEKVTIRGGSMKSSYGGSYSGYFRNALEEQLKQARLFDPAAPVAISCLITRNDLDGSGANTGTADLAATFSAMKNGKELYQKELTIHHEWPSSFVGAIAIPEAQQGYGMAVQKLVAELFTDQEFIKAVSQ